jgi:pilus assembly protein CpaF
VAFLQACVRGRLNIAASGGLVSGKVAVWPILAGMIPPDERLVAVMRGASDLR